MRERKQRRVSGAILNGTGRRPFKIAPLRGAGVFRTSVFRGLKHHGYQYCTANAAATQERAKGKGGEAKGKGRKAKGKGCRVHGTRFDRPASCTVYLCTVHPSCTLHPLPCTPFAPFALCSDEIPSRLAYPLRFHLRTMGR
jgi:hypothetical protein